MSVLKSKRNESDLQFLDTAMKLNIFSIQQCVKFPKRYTFYISHEIAETSSEILKNVKCANSIYPTNAHEAQMRRDHFISAYAYTQSLISQINVASELFPISGGVMTQWMELILSELNLLKSIMKSDKSRYKKFTKSDLEFDSKT